MAKQIWFGTRDYMQWVSAPAINMGASKSGWFNQTNFLNGRATVQRSVSAHKVYNLSWDLTSRENIRAITDYADGIYGLGPIYWADPFAMDTNLLPQVWAAPALGAYDGLVLNGTEDRPAIVQTPLNSFGFPINSALYTVSPLIEKPSVWIPIPPGYAAWVGAHGQTGTGGTVVVTPTTGPTTTAPAQALTLLPVTGSTRVNTTFSSVNYGGILVSLGGSGTITLSALTVQVFPLGATPASGGFISGQGHSGCSFSEQPSLTQYNAALDKVGLSADLVETDQWQ